MSSEATENYDTWNSDTKYALGFCKLLNQVFGTWPFDCQSLFSKIRVIFVCTLQVIMSLHCFFELRANCVDAREVVSVIAVLSAGVFIAIKVSVLRKNQMSMKSIIGSAVADWCNVKDPKSRDIMRGYAYIGRLFFIYEAVSVSLIVSAMAFSSLPIVVDQEITTNSSSLDSSSSTTDISVLTVVKKRTLPFGTDCFVANVPSGLYVTIYIFQVFQLFVSSVANIGNDACLFSLTMHVCAQFELINRRLKEFGDNQDVHNCRKVLGMLVRRHNHLMTVTTNFENAFNLIIFFLLAYCALLISLFGIEVLICLRADDISRVITGINAICILYVQIFLYSYVGDCLSSLNDKLRDAVYNCHWYDLSPTVTRDLAFVITNSNQSFHLTAGKIYAMNINNFKNIFKAMFSYFSMLRIMFDK